MISMTIQQLSVFLAVCDEMNYTRAASAVYMTRQAVRQNIAELEKELCGPLFQNNRNRLGLTEKGRLLRENAAPLVAQFHALQRTMNADIRLRHPLRLGISAALVPDYLPTLKDHLQSFRDFYPGLAIAEQTMENDLAVPALLEGKLDACLVMDLGGQYKGTQRTVLTRHKAGIFMKNTHPLFSQSAVNAEDFCPYSLFVPGLGEEFRPLFDAARSDSGAPGFDVLPSFYQVLYHVMDRNGLALNRILAGEDTDPAVARTVPLQGVPPLCSSMIVRDDELSLPLELLRDWLEAKLRDEFGGDRTT